MGAYSPETPIPDDTKVGEEVFPVLAQETEDPTSDSLNNAYVPPSGDTTRDGSEAAPVTPPTATPMGPLLTFAGIAIAALSLGLLTLAWFARRRLSDPLLR
jgi:hypothetical protein